MVRKVVSGGQTGVDRAAMDAAMALGVEVGGWCPKGRRAQDGPIPAIYPLTETTSESYASRTFGNVRDADATLIICRGKPTGGTALTIDFCEQLSRLYRVCQLQDNSNPAAGTCVASLANWLAASKVSVLNVAGPRESAQCPVYDRAYALLHSLFVAVRGG